jgi:hypothetical protein
LMRDPVQSELAEDPGRDRSSILNRLGNVGNPRKLGLSVAPAVVR